MTINPVMISLARDVREWSQADLAKAIGVSRSKIAKYELGALVCDRDLKPIADALNFHVEFFQQFEPIRGLAGDFLYRKRAYVPARVRRRIQAGANVMRIQVQRLLQHVDIETETRFPDIPPEERNGAIETIAADVRSAWRVRPGPIPNLTKLIESAGAIVFAIDLETDLIDGTNIRVPGLPPLLFLNNNVPGERHRFNLAHELAHVVMHSSVSLGDAENEAFRFASAFLMPRQEIRPDLRSLDLAAAARLKAFWGVSMAAIIKRAHDLEVISVSKYRRLFQTMNAKNLRTIEPLPLPFEEPESFNTMKKTCIESLDFSCEDMERLLFTNTLGPIDRTMKPRLKIASLGLFDDVQSSD